MWLLKCVWFIIKLILVIPFAVVFPTRVINKKELRKHRGKGVVFCCNHRSYMDGPLLYILFWRKRRFLVKPSMFDTKFKNANMRAVHCYPVERGKDLSLIKFAKGALANKEAIVMFPEGMRAFNPEDALALRNGAAMIAIMSGVPIVPMVLKRAPRPFRFNALKVGTTISTEKYQGRKMEKSDLAEVSAEIQSSMAKLLENFGVNPKPKWWEKQESIIARGIVIIDGKLLAIKRVRENQEYYVFPGGHIDDGETAREAAGREVTEETGVDVAPTRLLYKYKFDDKMQSFYYCAYKSGTPGKTDSEEYTDSDRGRGTYEPMLLDLNEISKMDIRPTCVRDQLLRDIEKYGVNLARSHKYVK
jgi:1-acyl-sn-glycerol-3-phosphate acyltransferase